MVWISWNKICRPFCQGGTVIKKIDVFNLVLLQKWKWRILVDIGSFWKSILEARYGNIRKTVLGVTSTRRFKSGSSWWKDLVNPVVESSLYSLPFSSTVCISVGSRTDIPFWSVCWAGDSPLQFSFPILFLLCSYKDVSGNDMGKWEEGVWKWSNFGTSYTDDQVTKTLVTFLHNFLVGKGPTEGAAHIEMLKLEPNGEYSVRYGYAGLVEFRELADENDARNKALSRVWSTFSLFRVRIFVWRCLLNGISSKD